MGITTASDDSALSCAAAPERVGPLRFAGEHGSHEPDSVFVFLVDRCASYDGENRYRVHQVTACPVHPSIAS